MRQFELVASLDERNVLGHVLARNVLRQLPHEIREDGLVVGDVGAHLRWVKSQRYIRIIDLFLGRIETLGMITIKGQ